jgi:hypothetical protein
MDLFSALFPVQAVVDAPESEPTPVPVDTETTGGAGNGYCVVA